MPFHIKKGTKAYVLKIEIHINHFPPSIFIPKSEFYIAKNVDSYIIRTINKEESGDYSTGSVCYSEGFTDIKTSKELIFTYDERVKVSPEFINEFENCLKIRRGIICLHPLRRGPKRGTKSKFYRCFYREGWLILIDKSYVHIIEG